MRKDWLLIIILVVCLVLLVAVLFWGESIGGGINNGDSDLIGTGDDSDVGSDDSVGTSSGGGSGSIEVGDGVVGDGVVGDGGAVASIPNVSSFECGFYFEEYGVCAGTCPGGECVSEGRSCYCKIV